VKEIYWFSVYLLLHILYVPNHPPHPPNPITCFDILVSVLRDIMLDGGSHPVSVTDYTPNIWRRNLISRIFAALSVCRKIRVTLCSLLCNNFVIAVAQRLFSGLPQSRSRFNLLLDLVGSIKDRMALKRNCLPKLRYTFLNHNFCILKCHLGPQYQGTQSHTTPKIMKRILGTKYLVTPVSGSWKCLSAVRDRPLVDCRHAFSDCVGARGRAHARTHARTRARAHTHKPQLFIKLLVMYHQMITRYRNVHIFRT
jgi:hypothetical protein